MQAEACHGIFSSHPGQVGPVTSCAVPQGTAASKKKKKKKLDRVMGTLKRKTRQGKAHQQHSFAALQLLHDPQARTCQSRA